MNGKSRKKSGKKSRKTSKKSRGKNLKAGKLREGKIEQEIYMAPQAAQTHVAREGEM